MPGWFNAEPSDGYQVDLLDRVGSRQLRPVARRLAGGLRYSMPDRSGHSDNSLRIEYQLARTVTTHPAMPAKNRTSKMRMIPIPIRVSMSKQDYTRVIARWKSAPPSVHGSQPTSPKSHVES